MNSIEECMGELHEGVYKLRESLCTSWGGHAIGMEWKALELLDIELERLENND